ncbi:hypothetical protein GIB67_005528 [Kingdonia uniflora]|uniref:AMP-dependent synthetase/ligase domain-containing protein n=1 Tax=Kingdonia uniflora TaxID=39325 RepID=A0A7J7NHK2_9MAGN|nr:hypothetical protein GIB67_005528 [Kingdonia uniflora]
MRYENYDPCFPDQPVVDLYLSLWANQPSFRSKPAFIWAEDDQGSTTGLTYSQLNSSAYSIASHLLTSSERRDTVLVLVPPGLDLIRVLFGCQRAGLVAVPISPPDLSLPKQNQHHHLVRVLSQTKPIALIAHSDYIATVERYVSPSSTASDNHLSDLLRKLKRIPLGDIKDKSSNANFDSYHGCNKDEVYLIQYTSGTTGIPKPVLVTAGAAAHNVRTARKAYDLHPSSIIASWLPQFHDCGLMFLLLTVITGCTSVLTSPSSFVKRPRLWLELITKFKATCTPVPSFALPLVVRRGHGTSPIHLWSLRNLIIINEPIYRSSIDEFMDKFSSMGLSESCISPSYGLAENCTFVSTSWRNNDDFRDIPSYKKILPSARLASTTSNEDEEDINIVVVNEESLAPVEDGVEGEIWVSSPSNGLGYLGYPSLTREIFHGRLRETLSRKFVRSGDRGVVIGEERYLYITGRSADLIKFQNGLEIHPHYIETAAYNCYPKLLRGGCVAAFELSQKVVVVAELQRGEGDINVLRGLCEGIRKGVLMEEKVDVGMVVLVKSGSVPKTTSGKIQRWLAKDKLTRGELISVCNIAFHDVSLYLVVPSLSIDHVAKGKSLSSSSLQGFPLLSFL